MLNAAEELCQETLRWTQIGCFTLLRIPESNASGFGTQRGIWVSFRLAEGAFISLEKNLHAGGRSKAEVAWKGILCPRTYRKRKKEWFLSYTGRWAQSWWENGCVKLWGQGLFGSCATDQYLSSLLCLHSKRIQFFLTEMFFLLLFVIIQHLAFHLTWKGWPNALVKESFAWSSDFIAL